MSTLCLECGAANGEHLDGCDMPEIAAQRGTDWKALATRLAEALRAQNYVSRATGFCVCVLMDGQRPDDDHAAPCGDARAALRDYAAATMEAA